VLTSTDQSHYLLLTLRHKTVPHGSGYKWRRPDLRSAVSSQTLGAKGRMPAAITNSLDLQWTFYPGFDIRNSAVATLHWKTSEPVDMYRFATPEESASALPLTKVLRLNYVSEEYELVALIEWGDVVSESLVKFITSETRAAVSELRQKHPERPNSWSRYFSAGDSHYKWSPAERRKEDLICRQSVFPNHDVCFYEGTSNRLRVTPEGQKVFDQLIVTLLLNLYFRETNMW